MIPVRRRVVTETKITQNNYEKGATVLGNPGRPGREALTHPHIDTSAAFADIFSNATPANTGPAFDGMLTTLRRVLIIVRISTGSHASPHTPANPGRLGSMACHRMNCKTQRPHEPT